MTYRINFNKTGPDSIANYISVQTRWNKTVTQCASCVHSKGAGGGGEIPWPLSSVYDLYRIVQEAAACATDTVIWN